MSSEKYSRTQRICQLLFKLEDNQINGDLLNIIDKRWKITPNQILDFIGKNLLEKQIHKLIPHINGKDWIIHLNTPIYNGSIDRKSLKYSENTNNKLPQIVGVTGRKYNGKDTVSNHICEHYKYTKIALADPIKEICRILFEFNDDQLHGKSKEIIDNRWNISPRTTFQYIGTELFRKQIYLLIPELGENFWIKCLLEDIKYQLKNDPQVKFIISDIRFQNEVDTLLSEYKNTIFIRVIRPSINLKLDRTGLHESEIMIDNLKNINYEIINDSSLESLYEKVENIMSEL